jgi:hypothetical protein
MTTAPATGTLYALTDPRTNTVRYIGQTTKTLPIRLAGHLTNPARKVAPWIDELADAGLQPVITAVREDIPAGDLLSAERDEITRRLLDGEPLLNEASTGEGRKILRQRAEDARKERCRAAWEHVAHQTRRVVGGPPAPGPIPPVRLPDGLWDHLPWIWETKEDLEQRDLFPAGGPIDEEGLALEMRLLDTENRLADALFQYVRDAWPKLWNVADDETAEELKRWVRGATGVRSASPEDTARLISLAPWCLVAVSPWASLADRAGLPLEPEPFIAWVSDDPDVQEQLRFVTSLRPLLFPALARLDPPHDRMRMSDYLAFAAAAHAPFELPEEVTRDARKLLHELGRQKMLTQPMADLLGALDPTALNQLFGRDLAAAADTQLGLPPGTAAAVLAHVLEAGGSFGALDRVVDRATGKLPTRSYPNYSSWHGKGTRRAETVVYTLVGAGLIKPPDDQTREEVMAQARSLWSPDEACMRA